MTRRSSVRAQARRNYCELKQTIPTATPTPGPSPQGGGEKQEAGREQNAAQAEPTLMQRIRALYEDSAVPVREIAAIAGVTERTLYKYVEKHDWKRRYRCVARDEAVAVANRGRRWRPQPQVQPAKGSGGRFIRREDKDKPFVSGLKALDPAGRLHAEARCGAAEPLAREAEAQALAAQRAERRIAALDLVHQAIKNLREYRQDHPKGATSQVEWRIETLLVQFFTIAVGRLEALLDEDDRHNAPIARPTARGNAPISR